MRHRHDTAKLHLPAPAFRHCLFMAVERDTRGRDLDAKSRFNFYPAAPFPTISWVLHGELRMVVGEAAGEPSALGPPIPRLTFAGPHDRPVASWAPGEVHALTLSVFPDFLKRVVPGMDAYRNRILPLADVLPEGDLLKACQAVQPGSAPYAQLEAAMAAWRHGSTSGDAFRPRFASWLASWALRAATTRTGAGLRRMQRQIRGLTGQSQRDLQLYARAERAFMAYARRDTEGGPRWDALALDAGYADQSHFGREVRRVTGFSPGYLNWRIENDETIWFYRLMEGFHRQTGEIAKG